MTRADLDAIYREHRRTLISIAMSITKCRSRAEDAVQTAFCRLCASGQRPNGDGLAYAFAAVRNAAVEAPGAALEAADVPSTEPDPRQDPLWDLIASEDCELVRAVVRALPIRQREVVVLRWYTGWTFRKIAAALDEPLATVTSRYRRALKQLREALEAPNWSRPAVPR